MTRIRIEAKSDVTNIGILKSFILHHPFCPKAKDIIEIVFTGLSAEKTNAKIGWIGTGIMGAPMAGHLLDGLQWQNRVFRISALRRDGTEQMCQAIYTQLESMGAEPNDAA